MDFQQFSDQHWRRTIPETYAAFAKAAAVLEATPMSKPKKMPRLLREIAETVLDIPLDLGNWLQGFLPWHVPDGITRPGAAAGRCGLSRGGAARHGAEGRCGSSSADACGRSCGTAAKA